MLSRRELLSMATLASFLQQRGVSAGSNGDEFRNDRIGISLRKPSPWHYHSALDFQSSRAKQVFAEEGERLKEFVADLDGLPLLVLGKDPPNYDGFTPSVTLWQHDDDGEELGDDLVAISQDAILGWSLLLDDVRTTQQPQLWSIGEVRLSVSEWEFLFRVDDGRSWHLRVRTLFTLRRGKGQTIQFYRESRRPEDATPLGSIEQSIRFY